MLSGKQKLVSVLCINYRHSPAELWKQLYSRSSWEITKPKKENQAALCEVGVLVVVLNLRPRPQKQLVFISVESNT